MQWPGARSHSKNSGLSNIIGSRGGLGKRLAGPQRGLDHSVLFDSRFGLGENGGDLGPRHDRRRALQARALRRSRFARPRRPQPAPHQERPTHEAANSKLAAGKSAEGTCDLARRDRIGGRQIVRCHCAGRYRSRHPRSPIRRARPTTCWSQSAHSAAASDRHLRVALSSGSQR
jgi:hypothetical protein